MASIHTSASSLRYIPPTEDNVLGSYQEVYQANRHRLFALAFWMTDNELLAEELMKQTFHRAFALSAYPSAEFLDRTLIAGLRKLMPLGKLSLNCDICTEAMGVRRNTMRVHLERAIVQVPPTERLVFLMHDVEDYDDELIGRCLGLSEMEIKCAAHQARLRIRELLSTMS
jgi:RNA polymerase sigma-70 factor (ECF subfamily)